MGKNILVLTGSPRKGGNSDKMADAFIRGAEKAGHNKITKIEAASLNLSPCKACDACYKNENACCVNDDYNKVAPLLEKADVIVFATPIYFYSFPAQIKMIIDKFNSFFIGQKPIQGKESVIMVCGGESSENIFDGILRSYDLITDLLQWKRVGKLIVNEVNSQGDIDKTDGLIRAEELGESI